MVGSVPGFEIAGYDKATLNAFSTRRAEAVAWARERNLDERSAAVMQQAVLYTRKRKDEPSREELSTIWKARMAELAPRNRRVSRGRSASHTRLDRERWHLERRDAANRQSPSALHAVRRAVEHLEERRTVFTADMLRALTLAPGQWTLPEIDAAIARLQGEGHLIEATAARSDLAFVTDKAVAAERAVLRWMKKESDAPDGFTVDADLVHHHLEASTLNDGQKAAASTLLLSPRHVVGVQGHAGTGKTTMLRQVVDLAGAERIVALAPSSSAARTLQRETGMDTKTLQWFLTRYRDVGDGCADARTLTRAREALEGTLLVVDEASLVSMAQMHSLARIAQTTGIARVALVGDKAQLRSVEAGQPFRVLQKAGMETAVMDEVMRQRDESLKAAVLHMIDQKPDLALEELGPGVLEMDADELGPHAAALWLDLDERAREATKVLAPTHLRRREITGAIREGLKAEGSLHGRTLEIERYVNLHLTRAQKGDLANWREGDVAVFHADVYGVQAKSGDIFGVIGSEEEKVLLKHPDGKTRRVDPSKYLRYRVELFETEALELQAGERIRWTRNDKERSLFNGEEARILWIGARTLKLQTADGRTLNLKHDDPQLHFIDHAWTSTVHAAQGITCDQVIAVLDANQGAIAGQAAFYVELSRARDNAVLLTDDREGLVEALETATGDELSALEAIGHQFQDDTAVTAAAVTEKEAIPSGVLNDAQILRDETRATLTRHLDARLGERAVLLDRARHPRMEENSALAGVEGHDAWRTQTCKTVEAWRDEMGDAPGDGAGKADLLEKLVAFDDGIAAFDRELQRHVRAAEAEGEDFVFYPGIDALVARGHALVETAPRPEEIPWYHLGFLDMVADTIRTREAQEAKALVAAEARFAQLVSNLAAAREGRQALRNLAQGRPLHELEGYAAWRQDAVAAVDAWRQAEVPEGDPERSGTLDSVRLGNAFAYDDDVAALLADWAAFEKRVQERGMEAILTDDPLLARVQHLVDAAPEGETPPEALTGILARHQARIAKREKVKARIEAAIGDYVSCHLTLRDRPLTQAEGIREWCAETKDAIATWRTIPGGTDPLLPYRVRTLENLIAFEERAHDVAVRMQNARGDDGKANPFLGADGTALAADLRSLQVGGPRFGELLSSLQAAAEELDRHETRSAERENAAAAVRQTLDDYRACHAPMLSVNEQLSGIAAWCAVTERAIGAWRAMTDPGERDQALSETAAALEGLIAFEGRARDVAVRLRGARGDDGKANPFLGAGDDALATDLRSLQAGLPRHGVMLSPLRQALVELEDHERSLARHAERQRAAATVIEGALEDYTTRHGQLRDRPGDEVKSIVAWCDATRHAIDTWRAMTDPGERDPAVSKMAAVLEKLIAFEERARTLHQRWSDARSAGGPFRTSGGDALAGDLRALMADLPRHGVLLSSLQQAAQELDRHEARAREQEKAAAAVVQALYAYRACHEPDDDPTNTLSKIRIWSLKTQHAVDAWRAMTEPGERSPALSQTATALEDLITFEDKARDLFLRWCFAGIGAASPFLRQTDMTLAADLGALEKDRPRHAIMLHALGPAFERLAEHDRAVARARELIERARHVDATRRALLEREGRTSRPFNRRFNKAWKRWRQTADAVAADIDATGQALIAHVDDHRVVSRVRAELAASERLDDVLPGWLLLRLHDNAVTAGATMHPAMTQDYAGIMQEMFRLEQGLREKDPRRPVLRGEIHRHNAIHDARNKVASLLGELKTHNVEAASLANAARRESLPVQQSIAWDQWYTQSRDLEKRARRVLTGREYRTVLHDGQGTRQTLEEILARFEETRTTHGEPDNSVRTEQSRKEMEELIRARSRHRGGGLSM